MISITVVGMGHTTSPGDTGTDYSWYHHTMGFIPKCRFVLSDQPLPFSHLPQFLSQNCDPHHMGPLVNFVLAQSADFNVFSCCLSFDLPHFPHLTPSSLLPSIPCWTRLTLLIPQYFDFAVPIAWFQTHYTSCALSFDMCSIINRSQWPSFMYNTNVNYHTEHCNNKCFVLIIPHWSW